MSNENTKDYGCSIEHFIKDEYSICREERQYALFLYNILRKYHSKELRKGEDKDIVMKIFDACNIPPQAEIENVFYEATFMRDFFERNRRLVLSKKSSEESGKTSEDTDITLLNKTFSPPDYYIENKEESFNTKLIAYVLTNRPNIKYMMIGQPNNAGVTDLEYNSSKSKGKKRKNKIDKYMMNAEQNIVVDIAVTGEEINLGSNAFELVCDGLSEEEIRNIKLEIKYMMNAKPDIAVIYSENIQKKNRKLLFLECKFESQESPYEGGFCQSDIQWKIADFLCENYLKDKVSVSEKMEKRKSCLVKFVRKEPEASRKPNESEEMNVPEDANKIKKAKGSKEIWIKELIELHEKIFSD